jgi:gliding motility-associated-like protein
MLIYFTLKNLKQYVMLFLAMLFLAQLNQQTFAQTRIYANTQTTGNNGILGVCIGCVVNNADNAVNANFSDYATLNVTVGVGGISTYETLIFPAANKPAAGTPVTVKIGTGDQLLSLNLLGAVSLQAYNGSTAIDQPVAASSLLTVLGSNNQAEVSITPTQAYDRIRVSLNGGLVSALNNIYLYGAFYKHASAAACNTAVDELNGISAGLLGLGASVGGVVNPQFAIDGDLTTASTLNAGVGLASAYAQQTIIFANTSVPGDSVRLTLSLPQTLLDAGLFTNIQVSTANGAVNNNDSKNLSSSLVNVRLLDVSGANRKVVVTFAPAQIFDRVQLRLGGGLASVLSTLNLYEAQRVIPRPTVSINGAATNNFTTCTAGNTATLAASASANTTINWYTAATGGNAVFTGTNFTTPAINNTTTYYAEAVRAGCTDASERMPVTIGVVPVPAVPVVTADAVSVCPGQNASFTAQNLAGTTISWYTTASGGTPVFSGNTFTTPALTSTTKYYAEASVNGQCTSATRKEVTANVIPVPANPTFTAANVDACAGLPTLFSIAQPVAGIQYNFYNTLTGGTPLYTGTNFTTPVLSANANYYVEAVNANRCTSAQRTMITASLQPKPANPVIVVSNATINAGQTATLTVTNVQTGIIYNWYATASAASPVFTGTTFQTPALYSSTSYYVEAVNNNGCTSANRTMATVTVNANFNAPCSFASQQTSAINPICVGCSVANGNLAIDADTTTASSINVVAGLLGGSAVQELVFQLAGLSGDQIKIAVQTPTGLADVNALNGIQVTVLNGTTVVGNYTVGDATVKVGVLSGGDNRFDIVVPATGVYDRVRIQLNSGAASILTSLRVYYAAEQFPQPVFNVNSTEICKGSTAQINITSPANGTFNWFTTPTGGNAVFTGTNFTTPALNASTTYYVEYTRNGCTVAARFPVSIQVDDAPAKPAAAFNSIAICAGETATLTATAAANATVKWFDAATGGNLLFTGNTFATPALSATTTYYAEAALGGCTSPDRTAIVVNVNQSPLNFAVTPVNQTVSTGGTATFTATSTTADAVFNWYNSATGGTSFHTGAVYTSPALSTTTTYYVEAVSPLGCRSANRIAVTATVTPAIPIGNPVACDAATAQTTDINGLVCVNCSVANPQNAVDQSTATYSQLNVAAGLLNAYAQQTLEFPNTGNAGDSVIVDLGLPANLLDLSVLSQIQLATYNGTTANNDRFAINNNAANVRILTNQNRLRVAFLATKDFDRVEVRLNSTAAGVLTSLKIFDAAEEVAAPVIANPAVTDCVGSQVTIAATAPNHVTIKWYTMPTGGTAVFTGQNFTTPPSTATTTYYTEASRTTTGCAQVIRTPVTITVSNPPAVPVVTVDEVTVCYNQRASFTAQNVAGVTYNWYTSASGGTPIFTGNTFVSDSLKSSTNFYVEAVARGQCASPARKQVTAMVSAPVTNPVATQSTVQTCAGSPATLSASSPQTGVTFQWFESLTATTPVYTGNNFTTPAITASQSYYVQAVSGSCISPDRVKVDVNVSPAPTAPTVTVNPANAQVSAGQTAMLTATSSTPNLTYRWYASAQGGTPLFEGAAFTTSALSSTTSYYVEAVSASGCVSVTRTETTIAVDPVFSATCDLASTQTNNVNNLCVGCTITNPANAIDADLTNYAEYHIPAGLVGGNIAQKLIFADQGIVGDTVKILIRVPGATLSAQSLSSVLLTSFIGTNSNNDQTSAGSNAVSVEVLAGGDRALLKFAPRAVFDRVELQLNSGAASALTTLQVYYATKQVELPQVTKNPVAICAGSTAVFQIANPRNAIVYQWFDAATGGTLLYTGTTFTTQPLTANATYYVQSKRDATNCINPIRVAVTAIVTPAPALPIVAQPNITICAGETVNLAVTNAAFNIVKWYDAPTGGNLMFIGANLQTTPIFTNTHFYAEIANGICPSAARADVAITINPRPAQPTFVADNITVCAGSSTTLEVSSPEPNVVYDWFTSQTGGNAVFTGIKYTTPGITQNTNFYVEARTTNGTCTNNGDRAVAMVEVNGSVGAPTLTSAQNSVCTGGTVTLAIANPSPNLIYNWFAAATGGAPVYTGTSFTLTNLTANATYYAEASNGANCTSASRTAAVVTVVPIPDQPTVQPSGLNICEGNTTTISIANPQTNLAYSWYSDANGGTAIFTGNQFTTPVLSANTVYYVAAFSSQNCNPSSRLAVRVNVNALPVASTLTADAATVCSGGKATFTIASPAAGVVYRWFDSPAKTNKLFEGSTFVSGPVADNIDFYVDAVNAAGCTSSGITAAHVTVTAAPNAPLLANNTVSVCSGSPATFSVANPQTGYTYNWFDTATGGTLLYTGTSFTTPSISTNTTYYVDATLNGSCTSATRSAATVNVRTAPAAATVSLATAVVCAGSPNTLTASSATANASFNWYLSATGGTAVYTGSTYTTPALTANTTYYVETVSSEGCTASTRTAAVITVGSRLNAPVLSVISKTASEIKFGWTSVTGASGYEISLDNGLTFISPGTGNVLSYTASGLEPAQKVTLVVRAKGVMDCQTSAGSQTVTATSVNPLGNTVWVPNAFTPNGDGNNDVLLVYGNAIKTINFSVYSHWGELIFNSTSLTNGWDGTYKGTIEPVGVYTYYVEAVTTDGQTVQTKGTITLIR